MNNPKVRVKIAKGVNSIKVSGTDINRTIFPLNDLKSFSGRKSIVFDCKFKNNKISNNGGRPTLIASLNTDFGQLTFDDKKYKGDINILLAPDKSCDVVNEIDMESYIASLLSREMNSAWPEEALKAQAVAARTYALHKMELQKFQKTEKGDIYYDLESSEKHQVSGDYSDLKDTTIAAAKGTRGEILLTPSGKLAPIFFHAKCGGKTLRPDQVWGNFVEGYRSVECPFCQGHNSIGWSNSIDLNRFEAFLKWASDRSLIRITRKKIERATSYQVTQDQSRSSLIRLYIDSELVIIPKTIFRRYFGRELVASNFFTIKAVRNGVIINGQGLGHGVGLCQMGALELAQRGWTYKKILAYYFPEHDLYKVY
jgi:stage II sporulation protein D